MSQTKDQDKLVWKVDVRTISLLGEGLITDRVTALFELIKNCYDANAENVTIEFKGIDKPGTDESQIIIEDDGFGMSFEDFRDKWMVIGTPNKRLIKFSPAPFNRRLVGEKGVGRFAVHKLGNKIDIYTKTKNEKRELNVSINWHDYDEFSESDQEKEPVLSLESYQENKSILSSEIDKEKRKVFFTEIENDFTFTEKNNNLHGTKMIISNLRENWTEADIDRAFWQITKLKSPFKIIKPDFNITLDVDGVIEKKTGIKKYNNKKIEVEAKKFYTAIIEIDFDKETGKQTIAKSWDETNAKFLYETVDKPLFGFIKMELCFVSSSDRANYKKFYGDNDIEGVKIYRDGIIATPFAEYAKNADLQRDILGIDKRRYTDAFNKLSSRQVIGIIEITREGNPQIIDATDRQDFIDNDEFQKLKVFLHEQLDVLGKYKKAETKKKNDEADNSLIDLKRQFGEISNDLKILREDIAEDKKIVIDSVIQEVVNAEKILDKNGRMFLNLTQEYGRREEMYESLISLQKFATLLAHAIRTLIGKIKRKSFELKERLPLYQEVPPLLTKYTSQIYTEMEQMLRLSDFLLEHAEKNEVEPFNVKNYVANIFEDSFGDAFESANVKTQIEIREDFTLSGNRYFFRDLIMILLDNSLKSLKSIENRQREIKCIGVDEPTQFILYLSDNGIGIPREVRKKIFNIFFSTTESGSGFGLWIAKIHMESFKGKIELMENNSNQYGVTFRLTFPFKK